MDPESASKAAVENDSRMASEESYQRAADARYSMQAFEGRLTQLEIKVNTILTMLRKVDER
jgi:hypothetical protein